MHKAAYRQGIDEYRKDLTSCIDSLENITGEKVLSYRAPGFSIKKHNVWAFEVLDELGLKYDASIFPAKRDHGGFDDFTVSSPSIIKYNGMQIKEFPMSSKHVERKIKQHIINLRKWGGLFIVLGAISPISHSVVSIGAGLIDYKFKYYLLWSLFRYLRFAIYYLVILQRML